MTAGRVAAITGGRYIDAYSKRVLVPSEAQLFGLWAILFNLAFSRVAHGAAIGTDQATARYLTRQSGGLIAIDPYPVNIRLDGPWPLAGHKRNRRMLTESGADTLFALPGHSGTTNCVNQAIELKRSVYTWIGDRNRGRYERIN